MAWLKLLRPKQWTKNLLVFAAALFTGSFDQTSVLRSFMAFGAMCLLSSATYALNDVRDAAQDRQHPKKRNRPVASGAIPPVGAAILSLVLFGAGLGLAFLLSVDCAFVALGYLALQAVYNLGLKRVPIADVFAIALGFVLRAVLGGVAISVAISGWLLFCTMALALMLGFSKRRDEFLRFEQDAASTRESLGGYSRPILDVCVGLFAAASILSYGVYSIESETAKAHPGLMTTTFFVAYGITRYLYRVFHDGVGEEPETILLTDPHVIFAVVGFVVAAATVVVVGENGIVPGWNIEFK